MADPLASDAKLDPQIEAALLELRRKGKDLRKLSTERKNKILGDLAASLKERADLILNANQKDLQNLSADSTPAFQDRLTLSQSRLGSMAESLIQVSQLPDPVGEVIESKTLNNGLKLQKVRAPLGTLLLIFESRPNVILEAFSLAFKSGNSIILRGGSDSRWTSEALYQLMSEVLSQNNFASSSFYPVQDYDRKVVESLLRRKDLIDVVIPRGGDKLIEFVQRTALMPLIKNDRGLCHTYVDEDADLEMAVRIVANGKISRPGVCNSLETVLVHKSCAESFLKMLDLATGSSKLQWRVDLPSQKFLPNKAEVRLASTTDWDTEHLDLILNCKLVESLDQAMEHIQLHGSQHSEAIVTSSESKARRFQDEVDAAAVYWNASTRFTDGFEFGLGGELGISTQKLHVRGPVGLRELTTPRWLIDGTGQIR